MKKLLLIEGESSETNRISTVLSNYKYNVKSVTDGSLGLEAIEDFKPDLLIIDLEGNEKVGLDVISKTSKDIPNASILVLTSALDNDLADQSLECGAHAFIHKPVDEKSLIAFLEK